MRAVAALLLLAAAAAASYDPLGFSEAVLRADVVAIGTVDGVGGRTYHLRVERAVAGAEKGERLEVRRFRDWTCAARGKPYARGQRILALLGRFDGKLAPLGAACEGEVFLDAGTARVVQLSYPLDVGEEELAEAVAELREGWRDAEPDAWRKLLASPRALVARSAVEKLYGDAWKREGLAAAIADAFPPLLAHEDPCVRLGVAEGLPRIVGKEAARRRAASLRDLGGRGGVAAALALCYVDPTDTEAMSALLAAAGGAPLGVEEDRAVRHLLYDAPELGEERRDLYPACRALLERDLPRDLAHALLIALRRWHGERAPLPHEKTEAERQAWLARLRAVR